MKKKVKSPRPQHHLSGRGSSRVSEANYECGRGNKKVAFTLAEVLITLAIVGVVAAMTIPTLIAKINDKVKEHKTSVVISKFTKGTKLLSIENGIGPYYNSTESFLNALSHHLKINKICTLDKIRECFPYNNIKTNYDEPVSLSLLTNGNSLHIPYSKIGKYDDTAGLILGDGTLMFLSYNQDCATSDPDDVNENTTSCVAGIIDLNGSRGPNKFGSDIIGFNGGNLGCAAKIGNTCLSSYVSPTYLTQSECEKNKDKLGLPKCLNVEKDYYAGALAACGGMENFITKEDLVNLYKNYFSNYDSDGQYSELGGLRFNKDSIEYKNYGILPSIWMVSENYILSHYNVRAISYISPHSGAYMSSWRNAEVTKAVGAICKWSD